ncbi:unnamed protein product [Leuciscus chuanchicus]
MEIFSMFVVFLFLYGVFGDTVGEIVSVMEGDNVTLHTGLTEVYIGDVIDWRFGPNAILIARVNRAAGTTKLYDDVIGGRDRLNINQQVGDLIITNIRTEHSGLYKLSIHGRNKEMIYNVSVLSDKTDGVKTVPVMEGDSVTLHTDVTEIQRYHLIQWIFRNIVISSIDKTSKVRAIKKHNAKPFLKKLEVDHETGSLKIRSIRTEQCGIYILQMTSSTHTIHKRFNITIFDAVKSVSVMKEDSVTLHTDLTDIYDEILWMFEYEDSLIAAFNRTDQNVSTYEGDDGRFRDRLKLDDQTGSLTITNTTTEHTGLYHLEIISSRHTLHKSFIVNVCNAVRTIRVNMGKPVTLDSGVTKIQKYFQLLWRFGDEDTLMEFNGTNFVFSRDGKFRDRFLYHKNGSITINDIGIEHSGFYHLEIISSRHTLVKRFNVIVTVAADLERPGYISLICVAVLLLAVTVGWIIYCCRIYRRGKTWSHDLRESQKDAATTTQYSFY